MHSFRLVLALLSLLAIHVLADKSAIGFEVMFFYYVYKMQYSTGDTVTIGGPRCKVASGGTCGFADFVRDIMDERFVQGYQPGSGDNTRTPTEQNLLAFDETDGRLPRLYKINRVLDGETQRISGAQVVHRIVAIANRARQNGGISSSDLQGMRDNARLALGQRFQAAKGPFATALKTFLTQDEIKFLVTDVDGWYDWRASYKALDDANDKGIISQETKVQYKTNIKSFAQSIRAPGLADETARSHLAILQEYQVAVTKADFWKRVGTATVGARCKGGITRTKRALNEFGHRAGKLAAWISKRRHESFSPAGFGASSIMAT